MLALVVIAVEFTNRRVGPFRRALSRNIGFLHR
jgi:hypothetical protein